jgi:hypothetical protein
MGDVGLTAELLGSWLLPEKHKYNDRAHASMLQLAAWLVRGLNRPQQQEQEQ